MLTFKDYPVQIQAVDAFNRGKEAHRRKEPVQKFEVEVPEAEPLALDKFPENYPVIKRLLEALLQPDPQKRWMPIIIRTSPPQM
jgi:hypothetical protein